MLMLKKENLDKKKILMLFTLSAMILFLGIFLFYRSFHDLSYAEEKCSKKATQEFKEFYRETNSNPEEVVYDTFYTNCLRDAGWIK
jgi:hypothetical protein